MLLSVLEISNKESNNRSFSFVRSVLKLQELNITRKKGCYGPSKHPLGASIQAIISAVPGPIVKRQGLLTGAVSFIGF